MTFEQQWNAAPYNHFYWLSWAAMLVIPTVGAAAVTIFFAPRGTVARRRFWHWLPALTCFFVTAEATMQAIALKWVLRAAAAHTEQEFERVAFRDTANRAFAPIIGAFCGAVSMAVWFIAAAVTRRVIARSARRRPEGQSSEVTGTVSPGV